MATDIILRVSSIFFQNDDSSGMLGIPTTFLCFHHVWFGETAQARACYIDKQPICLTIYIKSAILHTRATRIQLIHEKQREWFILKSSNTFLYAGLGEVGSYVSAKGSLRDAS